MSKVREPEPEGFEDWWAFWRPHMRHTDGRTDARKAYVKALLRGALPEDILDGARGYVRFMPEKDKPYIQLSETFLNKERYEDWKDKERDYQRRLAERAESNVTQFAPRGQTAFLKSYNSQKAGEP